MRKIRLITLVAFLLITSVVSNSCYGPFNLTSKLYSWNGDIGSKWSNSAVFFAFWVIPVYETTVFLDAVLFNAIEFWGGNNPISMSEGDKEIQIVRSGDKEYLITATKNMFQIEQVKGPQAGEIAEIIFVPGENSCYLNYQGDNTKLVEYIPVDDGMDKVNLFMPDGSILAMDADERNHDVIRMALESGSNFLTSRD